MTRNELFEQIKKGELNNVYIFYGQESYLMNTAINNIRNRLEKDNGGDIDYIYADGKSITADEIVEHCCTVSFLSQTKFIVVENFPALVNKDVKAEDGLPETLEKLEDVVLVFLCTAEVVKSSTFYKKLSAMACCVEFSSLSDNELKLFINREIGKYGKKIGSTEIDFLIQYTDTELNSLILELNKLALGSDDITISKTDIEESITPSREYKVYRLTDYIMERNIKESILLADILISQKEEAIFIVAVLAKTFHNCLITKHRLNEKCSSAIIAKELGIKEFALKKIMSYSQKYRLNQIEQCHDRLLLADEALKSSNIEQSQLLTVLLADLIKILND